MTRQMSAGSQIAFTRSWLERQGIEAQTIDVEAHIDPSLSYEENIKLMKRQFKLGGGRSRRKATRTMSAAECDVSIGNYQSGYNHDSMTEACECGHPDACVDLERAQRAAKPAKQAAAKPAKAAKPKPVAAPKRDWKVVGKHKWVAGAVITESHSGKKSTPKKAYVRFTATIRGYTNWKICEGFYNKCTTQDIIKKVQSIRDRIDRGDESVFKKATAKSPTRKPTKKPKKTVPELTATQKKRLAAKGSITIKRDGKFIKITK